MNVMEIHYNTSMAYKIGGRVVQIVSVGFLVIFAACVFLARNILFAPAYTGNLHMHTTCSDGESGYEEMIQAALKLQFDFVALTDHTICPDMTQKCAAETLILCIPGQEVTGDRIHLLSIGTTTYINQDLSLQRQVEEIHKHGGIAMAAHPNAKDFLYTDAELAESGIDAMECTSDINERRPLPCVYDSDAHNAHDLGWQYMSCAIPINTVTDLKTAILTKKCTRSFLPDFFPIRSPKVSN